MLVRAAAAIAIFIFLTTISVAQFNGGSSGNADANTFDVRTCGAKGDSKKVTDASITSGSHTVTSASGLFASSDVGKVIWGVETASGIARLPVGTITAFTSSTSVAASTTGTGNFNNVAVVWGTDDTTAIRSCVTLANALTPRGSIRVRAGGYIFSKVAFDFSYGSTSDAPPVIGDGATATVFYASPSFDFTSTSANQGMLARLQNANRSRFSGFTVDGASFSFSGASNYVLAGGGDALWQDVTVQWFNGLGGGIRTTSGAVLIKVIAQQIGSDGLIFAGGVDCYGCSSSNNSGHSVTVLNNNGASNTGNYLHWIGGIIDESTLDAVSVQASTEVLFIGTEIFAPANRFAINIDATSSVRVTNSRIVPFGTLNNRSGINVVAGGVLYLSQSVVDKVGSGVALTNAGTVYDLGGNTITSVSGTQPVPTFLNGVNCSGAPTAGFTTVGGVVTAC